MRIKYKIANECHCASTTRVLYTSLLLLDTKPNRWKVDDSQVWQWWKKTCDLSPAWDPAAWTGVGMCAYNSSTWCGGRKSRILILFLLYCMFEAILYYIKECLNNEVKIKLQFTPLTCSHKIHNWDYFKFRNMNS